MAKRVKQGRQDVPAVLRFCRRCGSYFHGTDAHPTGWRKGNATRRGW